MNQRFFSQRRGSLPRLAPLLFALAVSVFAAIPGTALAQGRIFYEAFDLADATPGQNLWRYTYTLDGFTFTRNQGFSVFFSHDLFRAIESPPPAVGADWSVLAVQPDLILRDPGFYDAQARVDSPAQNIRFSVSFVWLGSGTPGAQPYELYNADFSTRFSGQTLAVPEPSMPLLLALGGLGWILLRRALLQENQPFMTPSSSRCGRADTGKVERRMLRV